MSSVPRCPLRFRDLVERAAEMDGSRVGYLGREPRDRAVQCVVELEGARPVAPSFQSAAVAVRQQIAGERGELQPASRRTARACCSAARAAKRRVSLSRSRRPAIAAAQRVHLRLPASLREERASLRREPASAARVRTTHSPSAPAVETSAPRRRRTRRARPGSRTASPLSASPNALRRVQSA